MAPTGCGGHILENQYFPSPVDPCSFIGRHTPIVSIPVSRGNPIRRSRTAGRLAPLAPVVEGWVCLPLPNSRRRDERHTRLPDGREQRRERQRVDSGERLVLV